MAEIINQPELLEDIEVSSSRRPPTITGGRPKPDDTIVPDKPIDDNDNSNPDGITSPGSGESDAQPNSGNNDASVDGINGTESDTNISTDLTNVFGPYGDIFKDILSQLESILGTGHFIGDVTDHNAGRGSTFQQFLSAIREIATTMEGAEATNMSNALTQIMSYYMSSLSGLLQNQFNIQQWQIQQDYNSPKNQLKRLSAAGLNPLYAFGSDWSNKADSLQSSQLGQASTPSMTGDPSKFERVMGGIKSGLGIASSVASAAEGGIGLFQSAQKLANETAKTQQEIGESQSRQAKIGAEIQTMAQTYAFKDKENALQLESLWHQNRLTAARTDLTSDEREKLHAETASIIQGIALESGRFLRENKLSEKQIELWESNIRANYGNLSKTIAEAEGIRSKNDYDRWTYKFAQQSGIPLGTPLMDGMAIKAASGQLQVSELQNMSKFFRVIEGSKGNISLLSQAGNLSSLIEQGIDDSLRWMGNMKTLDFDVFNQFKQKWQGLENAFSSIKSSLSGSSDQNM